MKTAYYTDPEVRKLIDIALHQSALLHAKLGTRQLKDEKDNYVDDLKSPINWVKRMENKLLNSVKHLDPEFIQPLLYDIKTD
jgi:hypothetical protein